MGVVRRLQRLGTKGCPPYSLPGTLGAPKGNLHQSNAENATASAWLTLAIRLWDI